MHLTTSGSIQHDGFTIRNSEYGWLVTINGTEVGKADSLAECETLIAAHKDKVRANLARIMEQRKARAEAERAEAAVIAAATKRD